MKRAEGSGVQSPSLALSLDTSSYSKSRSGNVSLTHRCLSEGKSKNLLALDVAAPGKWKAKD